MCVQGEVCTPTELYSPSVHHPQEYDWPTQENAEATLIRVVSSKDAFECHRRRWVRHACGYIRVSPEASIGAQPYGHVLRGGGHQYHEEGCTAILVFCEHNSIGPIAQIVPGPWQSTRCNRRKKSERMSASSRTCGILGHMQ